MIKDKHTETTRSLIHDDFLLYNSTGASLYHKVAATLPIVDFHNHLNPEHLAQNKSFENITRLWIANDPYKHRAMRISGVPEIYISGNESFGKETFLKWAEVLPKTVGNPLYHWACLELKILFDIHEPLSPGNAEEIWNACNEKLKSDDYGTLGILQKFNVELTYTSDDLLDDLSHHQKASSSSAISILPSLRADSILNLDQPAFSGWINNLMEANAIIINDLESYKRAIKIRLDYFDSHGCLLTDHALNAGFRFNLPSDEAAGVLFKKHLGAGKLNTEELVLLQSHLLVFLGKEYRKRGWAMQLHIGAQRSTSTRLRTMAGPAGGYASIGETCDVDCLCRFLDALDRDNELPKTILYTLNPADYEVFATLTGSFSEDNVPAKIQFGPAWWFNDHLTGIEKQLVSLANYGLLSLFIGMTTDSRSVLSFSRHEYFRRILCNLIGSWAESGKISSDRAILTELVKNIAYNNAKNWLVKADGALFNQTIQ